MHAKPRGVNAEIMKKERARRSVASGAAVDRDDILPEYDFSRGKPNPYAARLRGVVKAVVLDADVAQSFPDSKAVNEALRALANIARRQPAKRGSRRRTA